MKNLFTSFLLIFCMLGQAQKVAQPEFIGSEDYGVLTNFLYDPVIANKIYASTFGNHLMVSEDNGETWEVLYSFPSVNRPFEIRYMKFTENQTAISFYEYYGGSMFDKVSIFDLSTNSIVKQFTPPNASEGPEIRSYSIYEGNSDIILMHTAANFSHHVTFYSTDG